MLIKRYQRFLADVRLDDGREVTCHCPNTGAMRGLVAEGTRVFLSYNPSPTRKYPYTWENALVEGERVGVNTGLPNRFVAHCLAHGLFPPLRGYREILREVVYDDASRVDFLLRADGLSDCYLEVKNVHFKEGNCALFPDSPTGRGVKHMGALRRQVQNGHRAIVLYIIQRGDVESFGFAHTLDPLYASAALEAHQAGVEAWAYACAQDSLAIWLKKKLPFV